MSIRCKRLVSCLVSTGLAGVSVPVMAGEVPTVPEPSMLSLLGLAGAAVAIVAIRKRRK